MVIIKLKKSYLSWVGVETDLMLIRLITNATTVTYGVAGFPRPVGGWLTA